MEIGESEGCENRMSEDLKEEMKRLKEEMAGLKDQFRNLTGAERPERRGMYIDIGSRVSDYVEDAMQGVAEGVHGEHAYPAGKNPSPGMNMVVGDDVVSRPPA